MGGGALGGAGPWGSRPGGGGFLQSALTTAAGVAGGMVIANALSHAFGGNEPGAQATGLAGLGDLGAGQGGASGPFSDITEPLYQNASDQNDSDQDDSDQDDSGADFGDGDGDGGDGGDWT
jgi:hypothetical protein